MATATRKNPPTPPSKVEPGNASPKPEGSIVLRGFDAVFRFLASVKLAVICLASLSATLAYGTRFNSWYGMAAANEYVYQTKWFALVLAFLAMNILCAALIRYPWSKRQTGFLITHVGLLTVIGGSWWSAQTFEEGLLGLLEGQTSGKVIRNHKPVIYVKPIDPHTGDSLGEYRVPFRPGSFDWAPGRFEVVSNAQDPFKLAVKKYYNASMPRTVFLPDESGPPMLKLRPRIKPPQGSSFVDVFPSEEDRWFVPNLQGIPRVAKDQMPAQFIFSFVESHEVFDDFLDPPVDPGKEGVARLHYTDQAGKNRFFDVKVDDAQVGKPISLPESDLTVSFAKVAHVPLDEPGLRRITGEAILNIVQFNVKKGIGAEIEHNGYDSLPTAPAVIPNREAGAKANTPLLQIYYYRPPVVDPQVNRRFGVIEVMGDDHGRMAYRVFSRGTPAKLGPHGPLKVDQEITAFGGTDVAPMTMTFSVEEFLQHGKEQEIAESIELPPNKIDESLAAALVELTVKGVTKEVWLRKSPNFDPAYRQVVFPDGIYEVALDADHMDLGFTLKLNDFDVGFDPGTSNASSYRSEVSLTDEAMGIKDKPVSIYMNNTLDHRGWRFFQTSFIRHQDPKTGQPTGEFMSIFQVARNPARDLIYVGCIVVVLGAFVQFYMRAGIFTDGGKREQQKAADKARKRLEAKFGKAPTPPTETTAPLVEDIEPL